MMYSQIILEHAKYPQNKRALKDATITQPGNNPLCGDSLTMYLRLNGDAVKEVTFEGTGCAISLAAASVLTEALPGKSKNEIEKLTTDDMLALLGGITLGPARIKCAVLALETAKVGLGQVNE